MRCNPRLPPSEDLSTPPATLPDNHVRATETPVRTSCCFSLSLPTFPSTLLPGGFSRALPVTTPLTGVNLRVSSLYYPPAFASYSDCTSAATLALPASAFNTSRSLGFRPNVLDFATITERSLVVNATAAGCYRIVFHVSGGMIMIIMMNII
jgi:hypothetical protein